MKFRFFSIFALSGLLLGSCAVDELPTEGGSIIAEMETEQTRTAVTDEGTFTWSAGDNVWLHTTSGSVVGTLSSGAGSSSATFSYGGFVGEMTGKAVYPHNDGHSISGDVLNFTLPASYDLGSSLTNTNAAMYGVNDGETFRFNHLAGVMRFKFKDVPAGVNKFTITLDKKINGTFTADLTADLPIIETEATGDASEKTVTINFDPLTSVSDICLYVPLPVGTYTTLGLELWTGSGSVWSYSNNVTNTIGRKTLKLMPLVTMGGSIGGDIENGDVIEAEKESWVQMAMTRASSDIAFAKDIPWQTGDKVMLIRTDSEKTLDQWGRVNMGEITYTCTVSKAAGLKCTLASDVPIETGVYHAVYPVYDYIYYDMSYSSLVLHLSFLYEEGLGLDYEHQDIVISEPVSYKKGQKLSFVMKHVCALADIDIYPPKTGSFSLLKVVAADPVFAGKVNYRINNEYDINEIADTWFNFATLRGSGKYMEEGELYQTSTGLLPVQYSGMSMSVYLVYEDGSYYLSEPFAMPSLQFGVQSKLTVDRFNKLDTPFQGLSGDCYMDTNPRPYDILFWENSAM